METALGVWRTARGPIPLDRPRILGILNVTPDSFSDGARHATPETALRHIERMLDDGADLIDIGGESTRPGAHPVPAEEERARVVPIVREALRRWPELIVSVDTVKADVARAALDEGAAVINDVSAFRLDPDMARLAADAGAGVVLMHSRGGVTEMARYTMARYGDDPVGEMVDELSEALARALRAGIQEEAIVLDPGLGFSKHTEESVAALAQLERFTDLGRPVLIGPSRKRFVAELAGGLPVDERVEATLAACVAGLFRGARLFRVHDVRAARRALDVAEAIRTAT